MQILLAETATIVARKSLVVVGDGYGVALRDKSGDVNSAGVAKLADARDLKSRGARAPYGFDSRSRHHT